MTKAQQDKQATIDKNVITLKEYLVNIQINNEYNRWLIQNKMDRYERKDKLAKIVEVNVTIITANCRCSDCL